MNKTRSLSIFITSVFSLALCVLVALCVEVADSPDENSSASDDSSNIIGVFETISFVDVSWETSKDSSATETSELSFDTDMSKNDDTSEDASNNETSSSVDASASSPDYSENSDQSEDPSPSEDNSSEKSSEPSSEEPSKETSKETSSTEVPSKEQSSEEPSSEEVPSEEPSSEESSEDASNGNTDFPDDVTILSGGKNPFVFFEQDSDEWKNVAYGSDKIGSHGCGPVCMAMIISSITGEVVYPDETAKWSVRNGYYAKGTGTSHGLMTAIAKEYDIPVTTLPSGSWTDVTKALKEGKLVVTRVKNGIFATNNHFFILRGITDDGKILVANSISYEDSVKEWSLSTIKGQVNLGFWVYG